MRRATGSCAAPSLELMLALLAGAAVAVSVVAGQLEQAPSTELATRGPAHDPHPVYLSEYKLRSEIQLLNVELRQLKRDFEKHIRELYFQMKLEARAKGVSGQVADAARLIGLEFADILVKEHVIKRRALAGLKMLYAKLLPIWILERLVERFPDNYGWLRHLNQLDLRPMFPEVGENYLIKLYSIIGQRVRVRAADDLLTMTTDNMKRILRVAQWFLIEKKEEEQSTGEPQPPVVSSEEKNMLAHFSKHIIEYYTDRIIRELSAVQEAYNRNTRTAFHLKEAAGGEGRFFEFLDRLINTETLEIQLNKEATGLDIPLTINADMIAHLESRWIPAKVLESLDADRRQLMGGRSKLVRQWVQVLEPDQEAADVASWCTFVERHICAHAPY